MSAMVSQITGVKRLFRRRSKKPSKLRVTGLCAWNPSVRGGSPPPPPPPPPQRATNAEMWPFDDVVMDPPHKGPAITSFVASFLVRLNKLLDNESACRCFDTSCRSFDSLWNVKVLLYFYIHYSSYLYSLQNENTPIKRHIISLSGA